MDDNEHVELEDILKKTKLKVRTDNRRTGFGEMLAHYMAEAGYLKCTPFCRVQH